MGPVGSWSIQPEHPESCKFNVHECIHYKQPQAGLVPGGGACECGWPGLLSRLPAAGGRGGIPGAASVSLIAYLQESSKSIMHLYVFKIIFLVKTAFLLPQHHLLRCHSFSVAATSSLLPTSTTNLSAPAS